MNIDKTKVNETDAVILVELPADDAGKLISEAFVTFRRQANIPGFRPGKVPMDLIRRRYGKDLMQEKAEEIAKERLSDIIQEADVSPGGPIDIKLLEYGEDKPLRFEVIFPLKPVVNLTNYRGLKIKISEAEVTEAEIDKEIEAQQTRLAEMEEVEGPATGESIISLKVEEVDPSGIALIGSETTEVNFEFGLGDIGVGADEQLIGIQVGEKRIISVKTNDPSVKTETESIIITPQQAADAQHQATETYYSVEALKIKAMVPPPVDDKLAASVNPNLKTVEELRKWIEIQLLAMVNYSMKQEMHTSLVEKLIEENPFPISQTFIDMFIAEAAKDNQIPQDKLEDYYKNNLEGVAAEYRWMLLKEAIIEAEDLDIDDEEIEAEYRRISEQISRSLEEIKKIYETEDNAEEELRGRMLERKVMEFLAQNADIEKEMLSLEEFAKQSKATH